MEHDGKWLTQSQSILRYLGKLYNYYPEDPALGWRIDSTIDSLGDIYNQFARAKFNPDAEQQKSLYETLLTKSFPAWFAILNKRLENNSTKDHIVGEAWTIADFALAAFFGSTVFNDANDHHVILKAELEKHEHLKHYAEKMHSDLAAYFEARPKPRPF
jgi:glutathione S-transferase